MNINPGTKKNIDHLANDFCRSSHRELQLSREHFLTPSYIYSTIYLSNGFLFSRRARHCCNILMMANKKMKQPLAVSSWTEIKKKSVIQLGEIGIRWINDHNRYVGKCNKAALPASSESEKKITGGLVYIIYIHIYLYRDAQRIEVYLYIYTTIIGWILYIGE